MVHVPYMHGVIISNASVSHGMYGTCTLHVWGIHTVLYLCVCDIHIMYRIHI